MKRIHLYPAVLAVLALGAFAACHRDDDRASTTNTTSATVEPIDRSGVAQVPAADDVAGAPDEVSAPRLVHAAIDGGATNVTIVTKTPAPIPTPAIGNGNAVDPDHDFGGVAPGHIMYPPGSAKGTGEPNTNGSHTLGTGNGTPR